MKQKRSRYYQDKYPLSILQNKVHKEAMRRTAEYWKEKKGYIVLHKDIEKILKVMHIYIKRMANTLHTKHTKNDPSVVHLHVGYLKSIFPKVLTDMYSQGKFTDAEFQVIQEELYPNTFKIYNRLIKKKKQWLKKNKFPDNTTPPPMAKRVWFQV